MLNADIISAIEDFAPASLQESWDNTGVQVGSLRAECTGVLLCVDVTPAVVDEARQRGCSLIISHHPLIFRGLKRISGNTPVEEAVIRAISYGITVYSCHTAVDSTRGGISYRMADMLGAKPVRVLSPLKDRRVKVSAVVNQSAADTALAVFSEIAGDRQCFASPCNGVNFHTDADDPFGSTTSDLAPALRIDATVSVDSSASLRQKLSESVGDAMLAFDLQPAADTDSSLGLGIYALLDTPLSGRELVERVKSAFGSPVARCTALPDDDIPIRRIALCGGSGSEFISAALRAGAQAFITSDTRYHDFVDYQNEILIIDIGHFESESCAKEIFYKVIREKFPNFACYYSEIEENPIKYI